jgi:hypothetical protein
LTSSSSSWVRDSSALKSEEALSACLRAWV